MTDVSSLYRSCLILQYYIALVAGGLLSGNLANGYDLEEIKLHFA